MLTLAMVWPLLRTHMHTLIVLLDFPWSLQHWFPAWSGADHHDVGDCYKVFIRLTDTFDSVPTVPPHESVLFFPTMNFADAQHRLLGLLLDFFPMVGSLHGN